MKVVSALRTIKKSVFADDLEKYCSPATNDCEFIPGTSLIRTASNETPQ